MKTNQERATEYAEGMMGEPYDYWVHHADKTLFNTIEKSYRAGAINNFAVDRLLYIESLRAPLIEQLQRQDWRNAIEIMNMMFKYQENEIKQTTEDK